MRGWFLALPLLLLLGAHAFRAERAQTLAASEESGLPFAVPNDNRLAAGSLRNGILELRLEARLASWEGEPDGLAVTVVGFAEEGEPVTIPGPLVRVPQGTEVRIRVRNSLPDSVGIGLPPESLREEGMRSVGGPALIVHGLRAGTVPNDTIHVARGEVREVRYRAEAPGTYLYRGALSNRQIRAWTGRDAQMAGAIVVDPAREAPHPDERIFVITMIDQFPDPAAPLEADDIFRRAINGRSWPDTERFRYEVGDTVRWRWVNGSGEVHPMHLHGFHYRVLAKGDGATDTTYSADTRRLAVTEHMAPGSTFRMEWVPERAGNWIFHCHVLDHIVPVVERDDDALVHDLHDVEQHALDAMAGLVLGIEVTDTRAALDEAPPHQRLRLLAQERRLEDGSEVRGFVLHEGAEPPADSVAPPGPPLLLTRGRTTAITVVNRLTEPTTVHWHGLELESVYDGVAGWSRTGSRIAPLIAPGDSFVVTITPPRAGTFIYHTHMDETDQLIQGMNGPFLVLEPWETYDPEVDRTFVLSGQTDPPYPITINGRREPEPIALHSGTRYRLRLINITAGADVELALLRDGEAVRWRPFAKDGAMLPPSLREESEARASTSVGETFDFLWTPVDTGDVTLSARYAQFRDRREVVLEQTFRVR